MRESMTANGVLRGVSVTTTLQFVFKVIITYYFSFSVHHLRLVADYLHAVKHTVLCMFAKSTGSE